jgi:ABC-2 type transport system permease protein
MNFLRAYASFAALSLKAGMKDRFSFYAAIFANFYSYFITYAILWAITRRFGDIDGWGFEDLSVLLGLNIFAYSVAGILFRYTVYQLDNEIASGNLDNCLARPMGVVQYLACRRFGSAFFGQIAVTVIFIAGALGEISYHMTAFSYVYLAAAAIGGILIQSGAMLIIGSLSFWGVRPQKIAAIFCGEIRSFTDYPLTIFPDFIRLGLTYFIPWAVINYYPSLIILRRVQTNEEFVIGILSPLIGIFFFLFSLSVFNAGLERYSGSEG